jgi:MFS transporter, Spinster family, sphingosine-1-phosphate transporter
MTLLMVFNHADRQVVAAMFPFLKAQWALRDTELGALVSVVPVIVAIGTIPLSLLADRWGQVRSLFLMAAIWSVATVACAFATRYGELLAARAVIGVGEAAYGSVGCALLATLFPERVRSTVLGTFLVGGLVGAVAGVMGGGIVTHYWGWQAGFVVAGAPGIVLAVLFYAAARRLAASAPARVARVDGVWRAAAAVFIEIGKARSAPLACLGAGLQLVSVSAMYAWLPSFLNREHGLSLSDSGVAAGLIVLAGVPGALAFGLLADRLTRRFTSARHYLAAAAALSTALFTFTAFGVADGGAVRLSLLVLGAATMPAIVGPVTAAMLEVVSPFARATAAGVLAAMQNLFGLALGPIMIGMLSDRFGLASAMSVVPLFSAAAGLFFIAAARAYPRDRARIDPGEPLATLRLSV